MCSTTEKGGAGVCARSHSPSLHSTLPTPVPCRYQPQPYHSNPGGPNPAKMSLVELIKLEEEEAEKQRHLRQQQHQQQHE